jgi:RimJ/RimL family protein N-acetyltransferase
MDVVRLPDGRGVRIRPIHSGDGPALRAAYDRLSPLSQYRRFLAPKPHLSGGETRYLVTVDGSDHVALVATPEADPEMIVAVARFVRLPDDPRAAEFAVVVGDDYHRQGVAAELLERLSREARLHGIERLRATVLAENLPAQRMVRRALPGEIITDHQAGIVSEIEVRLPR